MGKVAMVIRPPSVLRVWRLKLNWLQDEVNPTRGARNMAVGQNRFGVPFWLVGEFATHFRVEQNRMFAIG